MARFKKHRYDREPETAANFGATGRIKVGFNMAADDPNAKYKKPGRLPGFLLCHKQTDENGNPIVDFDSMLQIGDEFTEDAIKKAKAGGVNAPPGLLPTTLNFIVLCDAMKIDGLWEFGEAYSEKFCRFDGIGMVCQGDGVTAYERQADGGRKTVACIPVGSEGRAPKDCCKWSASEKKECKPNITMCVALFVPGAVLNSRSSTKFS